MRRETLCGRRSALQVGALFLLGGKEKTTEKRGRARLLIVRAHLSQKARKVGHPQDHLLGGVGETQERRQ